MSNPSVQSAFVNTLQARAVVGNSATQSSALHVSGPIIEHPAVGVLTVTGNVSAASLFNGFLSVAPTVNPSTYTLPSSAAVVAAFAAAGTPIVAGDMFEVAVQNTSGANGALFAIGADIIAGTALEPIPAQKSAVLVFRVISATSLTVYQLVSA